ncbi:Inner membrane protein of type IV secretion of T-DNA complex, TonB-like, VirB10 [Candidatus Burkholderia verschuerenii]|uniref:Inner membrane protein of type IV secretion of T-DNA complex, TonB-like, VirB10 n=1 Tax=Candidatus Burkholderia verschuerenii TaxID=242163 RepID=A0A0L0MGV3_9BURK|nr:type IV secretion system protein VirB10 [Candidatus Burkholderia verschuerenii]KND61525.1 Inner membrane protein of type IV secretion of T-DNA complex, TonB-like, VirB10 [Candidatus Burkholderia verschuerenii]
MSDENNIRPSDNAAPPPPPSGAGLAGERYVSEVAGRQGIVSKKTGVGVIIAGAAILCGVILLTSTKPNLKTEDGPRLAVHPEVAYVPPPPPAATVATSAPPLPQTAPPLPTQPVATPAATPARHETKLLVYTSGSTNAGNGTGPGAGLMSPWPVGGATGPDVPGIDASGGNGEPLTAGERQAQRETLASHLQATQLTGVSANVLRHQPFLLTMGTMVPCVLQTAMDSTLPGLVTCVIPQDIHGKTGLTLLDRGTSVVGEFKGGIRQGVERMFVVWTRAETPQGVVITLDSPATDPLGRSGMDGAVDRHFWQRFGGALLLSTVDGAIQAGVGAASKSWTTTINTGSTESVIAQSLQGTINLPPTIRKNQGEPVSILVARDLDFSTVYAVQPTPPQYVRAAGTQDRRMWTK